MQSIVGIKGFWNRYRDFDQQIFSEWTLYAISPQRGDWACVSGTVCQPWKAGSSIFTSENFGTVVSLSDSADCIRRKSWLYGKKTDGKNKARQRSFDRGFRTLCQSERIGGRTRNQLDTTEKWIQADLWRNTLRLSEKIQNAQSCKAAVGNKPACNWNCGSNGLSKSK